MYIHTHTHTYIYIHIHTCTYIYIHIHTSTHTSFCMRFSADSRLIRCLARGDECQSARPQFRKLHMHAKDRENMRSHANRLGRSQHLDLDFHFSVIASRTHMLAVILTGLPPHDLSSSIPFAGGSSTSSHLSSRLLLLGSPCAPILPNSTQHSPRYCHCQMNRRCIFVFRSWRQLMKCRWFASALQAHLIHARDWLRERAGKC